MNDSREKNWQRELVQAAERGDKNAVDTLLSQSANINWVDLDGWSALSRAASRGHVDLVSHLISQGALINGQNQNNGNTALIVAAEFGREDVVETLLNSGANVNLANNTGITALHEAAERGHLQIVSNLVKHGGNINAINRSLETPLLLSIGPEKYQMVKFLLSIPGINVNATDCAGNTPLHIASYNDSFEIVRILLENGGDRNLRNNSGWTALDIAKLRSKKKYELVADELAFYGRPPSEDQTALNLELRELKSRLSRKEEENQELSNNVSRLETEIQELKKMFEERMSRDAGLEKRIQEEMMPETRRVESETSQMRSLLEDQTSKIETFKSQLREDGNRFKGSIDYVMERLNRLEASSGIAEKIKVRSFHDVVDHPIEYSAKDLAQKTRVEASIDSSSNESGLVQLEPEMNDTEQKNSLTPSK